MTQDTDDSGTWGRKVAEAAFYWLLASIVFGLLSGAALGVGESIGLFLLWFAAPAGIVGFMCHLVLMVRRRRLAGGASEV